MSWSSHTRDVLLLAALNWSGTALAQQVVPVAPEPAEPVAPVAAPAAAPAAEPEPLRMNELAARLKRIERVLDNQVLLEMLRSIDQMQVEVRELRGEIERQTHDLDVLKQRQRDLYLDSDRRLRELELGVASRPTEPAPPVVPAPPPVIAPTPPAPTAAETPAGAEPQTAEPAQPVAAESPAGDPALEREAYAAAFDQLKSGRYDPAIEAFKDFLAKYPDGRYADNAQYWLGEANYVTRQFADALTQFQEVLARFPTSTKVADARLKIGYTHYELEEWEDARRVLEEVVRDYPNSSVARLAQQRIIRIKAEGH